MKMLLRGLAAVVLTAGAPPAQALAQADKPGATAPSPDEGLRASIEAITTIDSERLMADRDYAAEILDHLDQAEPLLPAEIVGDGSLDVIRLLALSVLERRSDIPEVVDRALARRPRDPGAYAAPLFASFAASDYARAVEVVETASRNVSGVGWAELRRLFSYESMGSLLHELRSQRQKALRVRLAGALFRIGWPGPPDQGGSDLLRSILIDDRLEAGDPAAAADLAASLTSPGSILPMIVQRRYDDVLAPGQDRLDFLGRAIAAREAATREALLVAPENPKLVHDRASHLRGLGRDAEALALLEPFMQDVAATVAASEEGMWLVNEAVFALIELQRSAEARALMERLTALSIEDNPSLIGPAINHAMVLIEAGDAAAALAHAQSVERESGHHANDYGKLWLAATIVCALGELDRAAEAEAYRARLYDEMEANPSAATLAHLCLGDSERAAALLVRRLEGDEAEGAILALQNYGLGAGAAGAGGDPHDRLMALRDRPDVRGALDRVGRVLTLPLARSYWGRF